MLEMAVDKAAYDAIIKKLEGVPDAMKNRVLKSATRAGANEIKKLAQAKAPSCIKIKTVSRRSGDGVMKMSVTAIGQDTIDKFTSTLNGANTCGSAVWYEFGTYQNRDLAKNPYAPATLRKKGYRDLGHTASIRWHQPGWWIPARPFLRPALVEAARSNIVEKAIGKKVDDYLRKLS